MNKKDPLLIVKAAAQMVQDLGIHTMPEEYKIPALQKISELLHQRVGLRLAESLKEDDLKAFHELINKGDDESIKELNRRFPDLDAVVAEEIEFLKEDIKELLPSHQKGEHK